MVVGVAVIDVSIEVMRGLFGVGVVDVLPVDEIRFAQLVRLLVLPIFDIRDVALFEAEIGFHFEHPLIHGGLVHHNLNPVVVVSLKDNNWGLWILGPDRFTEFIEELIEHFVLLEETLALGASCVLNRPFRDEIPIGEIT